MKRMDFIIDAYFKNVQAREIIIFSFEVCMHLERKSVNVIFFIRTRKYQYMRQYVVFSDLYKSIAMFGRARKDRKHPIIS